MKKLIFILFAFYTIQSNSQCFIDLEHLDNSTNYTFSQFETFALNSGYSYNSQKNNYVCDIEYTKDAHLTLTRKQNEMGYNVITHIYFQKSSYLNYKTILENNGKLSSSDTNNNSLTQSYLYKNKLFVLQTRTYNDINFYIITISNQKFN